MDYDLGYYDNGGNLLYGVDLYFYDNYSVNNLEVVVLDEELRHDLINYYNKVGSLFIDYLGTTI